MRNRLAILSIARARLIGACLAMLVCLLPASPWAQAVLSGGSGAGDRQNSHQRNILFTSLSVKDGLAQVSVNAIAQDRQGFLWFGTQEGLSRYNGYRFDNFFHDAEDPHSLAHNWVWTLLVDRNGTLWVGTYGGGLDRYDPQSGGFTHFVQDPKDPTSLSSDHVRVIYQTRNGDLWIGTDGGGLNRYDPAAGGGFIHYRYDPDDPGGLPDDKVTALLEDQEGHLWVGTDAGLARLDQMTGRFTRFRHDASRDDSLSDDHVRALYQDPDGSIWVGTDGGGLNRLGLEGRGFRHFLHDPDDPASLSSDTVHSIHRDPYGTLWVGTSSGLDQWLPDSRGFVRYGNDPTDPASLVDDRVRCITQDRGGVLWVGTTNGVSRWNYLSDAFVYYGETGGADSFLDNNLVTSVDQGPDTKIWVGTYGGGLSAIDRGAGRATHYRHDPDDPQSLASDEVMSVYVERPDRVWIGTRRDGLDRLDPSTGHIRHFRHSASDPHSLGGNGVARILGDPDGTLWVATYGGGLSRLPAGSDRFEVFRHDPQDPTSLSGDRVLALYRDHGGTLWVGTENGGLNRFDEDRKTFVHYRHEPGNNQSLGSDTAWDILEGRDGSLWIATHGGGLNRWRPEDRKDQRQRFLKYGVKQGLPSNTVQAILEDEDGHLWLSSNRGLSRFDPDTGDLSHFDNRNALKGNDFNQGARSRARDGSLMFGGATGLVVFHPQRIQVNRHRPPVVLSARSRSRLLARSSSVDGRIPQARLGYTDYSITFDFAALDFSSPDKNRYRYRLKGFDQEWINTLEYRRVRYTNLPPGDYRFEVRAANSDGLWNETPAAIDLRVDPPPWRSAWAYALYTLLVSGSLGMYVHLQRKRRHQEARQRERLEVLVAERTEEIGERNRELEDLNRRLREASITDTLTGLRNRRYFYEFIETEIARVERQVARRPGSGAGLYFMMIDLDGFKAINDTYGHDAGDRALLQVRDILNRCSRSSDRVIRWGGDEFLIVGDSQDRQATEHFAERLRVELAGHDYALGHGAVGHLSGSIGFVLYPFVPEVPGLLHWEAVMALADQAAYLAKENQRNAWVGIYSRATQTTAGALRDIRDDLQGLAQRGLVEVRTSIVTGLAGFQPRPEEAA